MKKIVFTFICVLAYSSLFAQSVFDQFEGVPAVNSLTINKKMFDLISKVKLDTSDKETLRYMNLIKKIDNLQVYRTQNDRISTQMLLVAENYSKTPGFKELLLTTDGGKVVRIHSKQAVNETQIKELLLFIQGGKSEETVLMSIMGDFDLNEVPALTDKMKISGSEELRRVVRH